jgi:hypothetical protein
MGRRLVSFDERTLDSKGGKIIIGWSNAIVLDELRVLGNISVPVTTHRGEIETEIWGYANPVEREAIITMLEGIREL